jgi:diketogulonate reductase-like aldo/keto reductase
MGNTSSIPEPPFSATTAIFSAKLALTDKLQMPKCAAQIPRLGFGVYKSTSSQCVALCTTALKVGYRHIDTAQDYDNDPEDGVGQAVRQSGLKRADVFITTKILAAGGSFAKSVQKSLASVQKIDGTDGYVDCFLIHNPNGGKETRAEIWQALEKLYEVGKAKSIGVSNFGVGHIEEMKTYATVWPPHVNQIQVFSASPNSRKACDHRGSANQCVAASVVSAKRGCQLLPEEQHHH